MNDMRIEIISKFHVEGDLPVPKYATKDSAAIDLCAVGMHSIGPGEVKMIPTGFAFHIGSALKLAGIPQNGDDAMTVAGLIIPRSGLGTKGLILANTVGLIDADYQGEIMIMAWNRNDAQTDNAPTFTINHGDRIAQMMFHFVLKPEFKLVSEFTDNTDRGAGGFGSTGVK